MDQGNTGVNIPFDRVIWSAAECAEYLRQEHSTFLKKTQFIEGFPPRLPMPGQPRWSALAVSNWALGIREITPELRQQAANS